MKSFELGTIPEGETFFEKGTNVLKSLASAVNKRGWGIDIRHVISQWERACQPFISNIADLDSNIIHADIWPPNVICERERVAGLIDFDDCCHGVTVIDLAIALMEFAMFHGVIMNERLAVSLLVNYFRQGGKLSPLEEELIVDAMEMTCAMWLAYNVIEAPTYEEAEIYSRRLEVLHDVNLRAKMCDNIMRFIATARKML